MLKMEDLGRVVRFVAESPAHVCINEIVVSPTWNRLILGGGEMWRRQGDREEVVAVEPGVCVTIPCGTHFQFRSLGEEPLGAIGVTMPPWPGEGEALPVPGKWKPSA